MNNVQYLQEIVIFGPKLGQLCFQFLFLFISLGFVQRPKHHLVWNFQWKQIHLQIPAQCRVRQCNDEKPFSVDTISPYHLKYRCDTIQMTSNIGDMINSPEMSSRGFEVWDTTTAIIVTSCQHNHQAPAQNLFESFLSTSLVQLARLRPRKLCCGAKLCGCKKIFAFRPILLLSLKLMHSNLAWQTTMTYQMLTRLKI